MALKLGEFNNIRKKIEKEVEIKAVQMVEQMKKLFVCIQKTGILVL